MLAYRRPRRYPAPMTATLHQFEISPFCNKARRMLRFKGVDFDVVEYPGFSATRAMKLSHAGKLPVLDVEGERIQDSSSIAAWLEHAYPTPSLYPAEPAVRAMALVWEEMADESLFWFELFFRFADEPEACAASVDLLCAGRPGIERALFGAIVPPMMQRRLRTQGLGRLEHNEVIARFGQHLDTLSDALSASDWLVGGAPSIADVAVVAQLSEIARTSPRRAMITERPRVAAWMARCDQEFPA